MAPTFTIITVSLNAEAVVAEAVESVLTQPVECEFIAVDGGSTDATASILASYEPRFAGRMRWVSEPDEGLYDAMNKGLARASGDYVAFLGADDRLAAGALDAVARALHAAEQPPGIVAGATHVFSAQAAWDEPARAVMRRGMAQRAPARHQSLFVSRPELCAAGGFDARFRIASDYDLYLRLREAGATEVLIAETLSEFRLGGVSSRDALATARDYRDVRVAHGSPKLVEDMVMLKSAAAAAAFGAWARLTRRGAGTSRGDRP